MRLPDVASRVRLTPVKMLRTVFTGVGQLLLAADRLRSEGSVPLDTQPQQDRQSGPLGRWRHRDDGVGAVLVAERRSQNGKAAKPAGRPYPNAVGKSKRAEKSKKSAKPKKAEKLKGDARPKKASKPKGKGKRGQGPSEQRRWRSLDSTGNVRLLTAEELPPLEPVMAEPRAAGKHAAPLPIVGYDGLSLASLRARLRNLDQAQLTQLVDYERANAARADIIGMFERRLARLAGDAGA